MSGRARRLGLVVAAVAAVAVAGALTGLATRLIDGPVERLTLGTRFAVRGTREPPGRVLIVAYDNATLRALPYRPPVPRRVLAEVIDHLDAAGAAVIAVDYSLEQGSGDPGEDRAVALAAMNARHAVVSVAAPGPDGGVAPLAGFLPFADTGVAAGYTPLALDPEGRVTGFARPPGRLLPFGVAAARMLPGAPRAAVPARALVDYPGPTGTFPQLSYQDVLHDDFDHAAARGKLVIVGPTATVLGDLHHVPVDSVMPGPEVHAAQAATTLEGFPLRTVTAAVARRDVAGAALAVPLLLLALSGLLLAVRQRTGAGGVLLAPPSTAVVAAVGAAGLAGWLVLAQIAFDRGAVHEVTPPLVAIVTAAVVAGLLAARASHAARRRARARFAANDRGVVTRVLASGRRGRAVTASDVVAGYTIVAPLGHGGMGDVYRAEQHRLARPVALKLIRGGGTDPARRRRFVQEAYAAASVAHPNVVEILTAGEDDGVLFIAMQLVEGSDLGHLLQRVRLDPAYAVAMLHRVACALDAAHRQGVVHRDVKPSNILIPAVSPDHPYLTDFGIAGWRRDDDAVTAGEGTLPFMAPERFDGDHGGRPADVYALAAVLYQCLTGSRPFPTRRAEAIRAHRAPRRPSVTVARPELPAAIDAVLARGLAVAPADRPESARALTLAAAEALEAAVVDDVVGPAAEATAEQRPRPELRSGDEPDALEPTETA